MPAVFVHGITVRKDRFDALLDTVRAGLQARGLAMPVTGFYWGDMATSPNFRGASIPGFLEGKRAVELAVRTGTEEQQLLMLLLDDPLIELTLLKDKDDFDPAGAGYMPLPPSVEHRNQTLEASRAPVAKKFAGDANLAAAAGKDIAEPRWQDIVKSSFEAAAKTDRSLSVADLLDPLARSLTASLYREVEGEETKLDTAFRWKEAEARIEKILEDELGGQRSWLGDKLKKAAGGAAAHTATFAMRHGLRKRVMEATSMFIGDVLAYMSNRDKIQAELENAVTGALAVHDGPLWLVGHSLGGILCFDYCLNTPRKVERLLTVGSQVGLFGELGAFPKTKINAHGTLETPSNVGTWINMFDPDDILSFLAKPILTNVTDVEFDTRTPFPVCHSEYWNMDQVYATLVK